MKVRAIEDGFIYGSYKFRGSVFEIRTEKEFSDKWMEEVSDEEAVKLAPTKTGGPFANPKEQSQPNYEQVLNRTPTPLTELEAAAPDPHPVVEPEGETDGPPTGDQFRI